MGGYPQKPRIAVENLGLGQMLGTTEIRCSIITVQFWVVWVWSVDTQLHLWVVFGRTCATMIDPVCALCGFSHGFFPPRGWSGHHLGALQLRLGATQLAHGLVEPQEDLLLPLGSNGLWGGWIGEELFVEVRNWVVVPNIYIYIYIYISFICLFCTSTYLNVFEMSYTSVQCIVYIYGDYIVHIYIYIIIFIINIYIYIYTHTHTYYIEILYRDIFLAGLNMIEPQARCWWSHHYFAEKLPS